jgi:hypothetical protein
LLYGSVTRLSDGGGPRRQPSAPKPRGRTLAFTREDESDREVRGIETGFLDAEISGCTGYCNGRGPTCFVETINDALRRRCIAEEKPG